MSGEFFILIWVLVAAAFALGWGVRTWLHRPDKDQDVASRPPSEAEVIDIRDEKERDVDLREATGHSADRDNSAE